jgi:hypothetical protein
MIEAAARVGLIATVSVIIVISTLLPLLKEPARSSDTRTLAAFAVPLARNARLPAIDQAGDRTSQISSPPENNPGATNAPARVMPAADLLSASSPPPTLIGEQRPTEGAATQLSAVSSQPVPVAAVKEPPRAEQRAKRRNSNDTVRSRPALSFNNTSHWAYRRAPAARSGSISSSYNDRLAPRSN